MSSEVAADVRRPAAAASPAQPVIDVREVSKSYRIYARPIDRFKQALAWGRRQYYRDFWALREVSFDVAAGEAVGIVGRNGSGKSTLLQIIAGTLSPTDGVVAVAGRVAALLELGSGFNPEFTGRENVYMNGAILGLSQREIERRFDEIASFADIGEFVDQPVKTYSSGMMMRLAFSVATCVEPDILIVDEALSVGDMLFQQRCIDRIRKLCQGGTTLLFVSHDPESVRSLCQRAVWLDQGRVRMVGAARDVADEYVRAFAVQRNADVLDRERSDAPEDIFTPLDTAVESLDGGDVLRVESVRLLNSRGEPTEGLQPDERFTIEVVILPLRDIDHVSVGLVLKTRLGVELTGESVFNAFRRGLRLRRGERRTIRFTTVNNLRAGQYGAALRAHYVTRWDRSDALLLYSDEVALAFYVTPDAESPLWFQYRHPFEVSIS